MDKHNIKQCLTNEAEAVDDIMENIINEAVMLVKNNKNTFAKDIQKYNEQLKGISTEQSKLYNMIVKYDEIIA